jgi:hypothetical protein
MESYKWEIYLQCKAGGTHSHDPNDQEQHLKGNVLAFEYFFSTVADELELDRQYTWIQCNKNFKSFYTTSYSDDIVKALSTVLKYANQVKSI